VEAGAGADSDFGSCLASNLDTVTLSFSLALLLSRGFVFSFELAVLLALLPSLFEMFLRLDLGSLLCVVFIDCSIDKLRE